MLTYFIFLTIPRDAVIVHILQIRKLRTLRCQVTYPRLPSWCVMVPSCQLKHFGSKICAFNYMLSEEINKWPLNYKWESLQVFSFLLCILMVFAQ
jgi:hypothetical protein